MFPKLENKKGSKECWLCNLLFVVIDLFVFNFNILSTSSCSCSSLFMLCSFSWIMFLFLVALAWPNEQNSRSCSTMYQLCCPEFEERRIEQWAWHPELILLVQLTERVNLSIYRCCEPSLSKNNIRLNLDKIWLKERDLNRYVRDIFLDIENMFNQTVFK